MKTVIGFLAAVILLTGCIERVERRTDGFDQSKVTAACEKIISKYQEMIKQRLIEAMEAGGPENALAVCHTVAPMIADSFSNLAGIDLRRVSLRMRNKQFAPDEFETAVLQKFEIEASAEPQSYGEMVVDSGRVKHFRYLKEIKVGQLCLKCHGNPAQFSKTLKTALADYPGDPAVGYGIGDSRGAYSVEVHYPEARASITAILSEDGR